MHRTALGLFSVLALAIAPVWCAAAEDTAAVSVTVQPNGPRSGSTATRFFNIEGKNNEKYASFGVLEFKPAKADAAKAAGLTLSLTQSIARFSKNGKFKVYLSADLKSAPETLKFQGENGVERQLAPLYPVGESAFEKGESGKVDVIALKLDDKALSAFRSQTAEGGTVRLVLVPADNDVAATYFGVAAENPEQRPKLALHAAP